MRTAVSPSDERRAFLRRTVRGLREQARRARSMRSLRGNCRLLSRYRHPAPLAQFVNVGVTKPKDDFSAFSYGIEAVHDGNRAQNVNRLAAGVLFERLGLRHQPQFGATVAHVPAIRGVHEIWR